MKREISLEYIYQIKPKIQWETRDGVVYVSSANDHWSQRCMRRLGFRIPKTTTIQLDRYGSVILPLIDGSNSILDIGKKLAYEVEEARQDLYERLTSYLSYLEHEKKWIQVREIE